MFGTKSLGLHIIQFPSKRWGFVGAIPTVLGIEVAASEEAVMGCRVHRNAAGELVEWRFPSFDTEAEARAFAATKNCTLSN